MYSHSIITFEEFLISDFLFRTDPSASENNSRQSNQFNSIEKTEENSTPQVMKKPTMAPPSPPIQPKHVSMQQYGQVPILQQPPKVKKHAVVVTATTGDSSDEEDEEEDEDEEDEDEEEAANLNSQQSNHLSSGGGGVPKHFAGSKGQLHSPLGSAHSFDLQVSRLSFIVLFYFSESLRIFEIV